MKAVHGSRSLLSYPEKEEAWSAQTLRTEADRAFARARRRSIIRLVGRRLGWDPDGRGDRRELRGPEPCGWAAAKPEAGARMVPRSSIAGIHVDGEFRPFPVLAAGHRPAWRRAFEQVDRELYPPLEARSSGGLWYLMGGVQAYVLLEVLRSRGNDEIALVAARGSPAEVRCRILGKEGRGRGSELHTAGRGSSDEACRSRAAS